MTIIKLNIPHLLYEIVRKFFIIQDALSMCNLLPSTLQKYNVNSVNSRPIAIWQGTMPDNLFFYYFMCPLVLTDPFGTHFLKKYINWPQEKKKVNFVNRQREKNSEICQLVERKGECAINQLVMAK